MAGIYIHIPFCKQACHYCDFHFSTSLKKKDDLLEALKKELQLRVDEVKVPIETIYFGGGTPSVLSSEELKSLIETVYANYSVVATPEITLEANPDDLFSSRAQSRDIFTQYKTIGINRLSIGVQSFFEEDLKLMNRAHSAQEAEDCIALARQYFENLSVDLIYGIPGLTDKRWITNIEKTLAFEIPHISSYALTVEPKTALKSFIDKGLVPEVDDEQAQRQFLILVDRLEEAGFVNYELSNFGKEGYYSQNNTAYWQGKTYLGIGPSAHSFNGHQRSWNVANNSKYINALAKNQVPAEIEKLSTTDRYNEYVMTGLRTVWGVSLEKITADFGANYREHLLQQARRHIEAHLLFLDEDHLFTTRKGKFLADGLASDLFLLNLGK